MQELKTKMIFENKISEKTRALLKSIELNELPIDINSNFFGKIS